MDGHKKVGTWELVPLHRDRGLRIDLVGREGTA